MAMSVYHVIICLFVVTETMNSTHNDMRVQWPDLWHNLFDVLSAAKCSS